MPPEQTKPLTEIFVKSNITEAPRSVRAGEAAVLRGFAFSGAPDVARVEISDDGGANWRAAELDPRHDPYAWRRWSFRWVAPSAGRATLLARATDSRGSVQPKEAVWNPSGYLFNAWHSAEIEVDGVKRALRVVLALAIAATLASRAATLASSGRKKPRPKPTPVADFDVKLPVLGTRLAEFPEGPGKSAADLACLQCHSASMVLQQRLTSKQWEKELDKMIGWGAAVPADRKAELLAYLEARFGPDNDGFEPLVTRPVGK